MAWDLEGLISSLVMVISCAGEGGCTVAEVLQHIQQTLSGGDVSADSTNENAKLAGGKGISHHGLASVWRWITEREDVSVGPDRKYNHLSLDEILALTKTSYSGPDAHHRNDSAPKDSTGASIAIPEDTSPAMPEHNVRSDDIKVYTSEETMWESITGHGIDYRRVPRSEWLLLMGIATKKGDGILQGALGRLVDQDKRSVPKRTDALVKKGYIIKRTTLVRGTKTSMMWLRRFAPKNPKEDDADDSSTGDLMLSREYLSQNLEAVPWHNRWTADAIDYKAFATTIMALVKEWGVMKMVDLKVKLGVLGSRWQMKVMAKTCRFLNARGTIQYVAAKLGPDSKLFKDCIKFVRDMNSQDWALYLSTGKRGSASNRAVAVDETRAPNGEGEGISLHTRASLLKTCRPWTVDEPLALYLVKAVRFFGNTGLTNPDIYCLTLGPAYTRYVSMLTSLLATSIPQPDHLRHWKLQYDNIRSGKIASYRYFMQPYEPAGVGTRRFCSSY